MYFRIVRDRSTFNTGLNSLDDMIIRLFQVFAGIRSHELGYEGEPMDKYIQPRPTPCWVAVYKGLCWEDIVLWILRNPKGKAKDFLAVFSLSSGKEQ